MIDSNLNFPRRKCKVVSFPVQCLTLPMLPHQPTLTHKKFNIFRSRKFITHRICLSVGLVPSTLLFITVCSIFILLFPLLCFTLFRANTSLNNIKFEENMSSKEYFYFLNIFIALESLDKAKDMKMN